MKMKHITAVSRRRKIRARLSDNTCSAAGVTASGRTPVLALCRELLAAGLGPDSAVEVFRAGTLALRVRSLVEGAALTVDESNGTVFSPWKPFPRSAVEPRTATDDRAAILEAVP
jgi:hypothetical protein